MQVYGRTIQKFARHVNALSFKHLTKLSIVRGLSFL